MKNTASVPNIRKGRCIVVSLDLKRNESKYTTIHIEKTLSISPKKFLNNIISDVQNRGTARCTCFKAILTIETAVVLPFFVCFMVFVLYFFRLLQIQTGVSQALQYAGRRVAAEYSVQAGKEKETDGKTEQSDLLGLVRARLLFEKQLKKQKCPIRYISHGTAGISLMQSDFSDHYVELKAVYRMKLPISLFGSIQYRIVQQAKCRKWTGYAIGQDTQDEETWLYYTEHGTVYHASRDCTHLDLSIRGITYTQVGSSRNKNGGKYHKCERCNHADIGNSMVYITDYGDRYHTSLVCGSLKRSIYMIRRSKATEKRMCSKCGG